MQRKTLIAIIATASIAVIGAMAFTLVTNRGGISRVMGSTRFEPYNPGWREGIQDLYASNAETVVLGDSNSDVVDWTSALGIPVSNRAFSGNTVARTATRPVLKAKTVIFILGINDLKFGSSAEATTQNYLRLLEAYRSTGARLVVVAPFTGVDWLIAPVAQLNAALAANCACTFVDMRPAFGGEPVDRRYSYDGIHLTVDGYRELIAAVRRAL